MTAPAIPDAVAAVAETPRLASGATGINECGSDAKALGTHAGSAAEPDVSVHLPMLLAGLAWLFDVSHPDTAIVHCDGQSVRSAAHRTLGFRPSKPPGHVTITLESDCGDCPRRSEQPQNPLEPGELAALVDLLEGMGENALSFAGGYPASEASVVLAKAAHPSLRAAVTRYHHGCPEHDGNDDCDCGWFTHATDSTISVHDLHQQAVQRRSSSCNLGPDIANILIANAHRAARHQWSRSLRIGTEMVCSTDK